MHPHEGIDRLLIFGAANAHGFPVRRNPARFIRFGIRPQLQGFAGAQTGERLENKLPAQGFRTDVREHQLADFMHRLGVMRHEIPAVLDALGATIARSPERQGVLLDEVATHSPKHRVAQGVQFHVHGPVALAATNIPFAPFVVAIQLLEGNAVHGERIPVFQQHGAVALFTLERPALARLFLAVGVAVLHITPDDFTHGHFGFLGLLRLPLNHPGTAAVKFFTRIFEIGGFERAPSAPPVDVGTFVINAGWDVAENPRFHPLELSDGRACFFELRFHVVFAFCLARYNRPFSGADSRGLKYGLKRFF